VAISKFVWRNHFQVLRHMAARWVLVIEVGRPHCFTMWTLCELLSVLKVGQLTVPEGMTQEKARQKHNVSKAKLQKSHSIFPEYLISDTDQLYSEVERD
jgi:hypothetical protein